MGNLCHVDGFVITDWLVSKMALDGSIIVEIWDETMAKMWHKQSKYMGKNLKRKTCVKLNGSRWCDVTFSHYVGTDHVS